MDEKAIVVEQLFECPPGGLWEAITDLQQMKQWFFNNIPSFEPVVGFPGEIPEFSRESCTAGWNFFINKSLKEYMELKRTEKQ